VIAVTSPLEGDGKTTIAGGLAEVLAHSGQNVIAVDCDLRSPALHEQLGLERSAGVQDALVELRDLEDLLQEASPGLRVLTAGAGTLDAFGVVLALQRLPDLLSRLREMADYVIVDTPPISVAADASTIVAATDDVLLVVDPNRARRDVLSAARDQLLHVRAHILGVVINRAPAPLLGASYGSYWAQDDELPAPLPGSRRS
jgi:non-specific protein-tyrosine kinase